MKIIDEILRDAITRAKQEGQLKRMIKFPPFINDFAFDEELEKIKNILTEYRNELYANG